VKGEDILNVLLDVEWVVGSFVADAAGQLLVYQMPPEFGETELKRTTVRLASILRCAELCELGVEQCALSLNRYQLLMSRFRNGFLCVMVEAPVNRRALEMATRIALECLPALVDSLAADAPASEQTQAERALAQSLDRATSVPGSDPEPVPDPERATEPPPSDPARSGAELAGDDLPNEVTEELTGLAPGRVPGHVPGNGSLEPRNLEDDRAN
jgi:hypothetical protein